MMIESIKSEDDLSKSHLKELSQQGKFEKIIKLVEAKNSHLKGLNWDVNHCFYHAFSNLRLKEFMRSLQGWETILENSPQNWKAHYFKGLSLSSMKQYEESLKSFYYCLQINAKYYKAWFQQGNAFFFLSRFKEAEERLIVCVRLAPKFTQAWTNLGNCYLKTGKFERAIECYDTVLEKNPANHIAWYNKGYALDELGDNPEAVFCFEKCLEIKQDYVKGWFNLAVVETRMKDYESALQHFNKCLEINPNFIRALNDKGYLLNRMGLFKFALESFKTAEQINPDYPDCLNGQAMILKKMGKYDEAKTLLDKALGIYKSFIRAYINRADLFRRQHDMERCKRDLDIIEKMIESQRNLDKIYHTPKKFLELRYFSSYKKMMEVYKKLFYQESFRKSQMSSSDDFESYIKKIIDSVLFEEINEISNLIDMKDDIVRIEEEIKDIEMFLESKKFIFDSLRRSSLTRKKGSNSYKKRFFELILKHKKLANIDQSNNKKTNKFYEWFFGSWIQKFENAVTLTDEFIKYTYDDQKSPNNMNEMNLTLENGNEEIKADMHFQKFIQILINAETLMQNEKNSEIKNIFKKDFESFGFGNIPMNFPSFAKFVVNGN